METLALLGVIILLFWTANLSNRLKRLEKGGSEVVKAAPFAVQMPQPSAPQAFTQPVAPKASEEEVATGWLTKIGVVALLFGVGFFLKYAIDQGWIGQWARIIMGLLAGGLLIVLGEIWRTRYEKYAAALSGGGLALLYFSIFAGYQFYHLFPQAVGAAAMIATTALGVFLAARGKQAAIGALAVVGGYLTPLLLYTDRDQQLALFVYLTVLNLAACSVLSKHYWHELLYLALFGTALDFSLWAAAHSNPDNAFVTFVFLGIWEVVFMIFAMLAFRRAAAGKSLPERADYYLGFWGALAAIFFFVSGFAIFFEHFRDMLPLLFLGQAVVVWVGYLIIAGLAEAKAARGVLAFAGLAVLSAAAWRQFDGKTLDVALIVLALLGLAIGATARRAEIRLSAFVLLVVTVPLTLLSSYDIVSYQLFANSKFGLMLLEVAAFAMASWIYRQDPGQGFDREGARAAAAIAVVLLWFGVSWEIVTFFRDSGAHNARNLFMSLWWIVYGAILITAGALARSPLLRRLAIFFFGLSIIKVFLYDVQSLETGYRVVSFITLGVILLSVSYAYHKNKEKIAAFLKGQEKIESL